MKNKILTKIGALVVGLTMAVGVGIAVSNNVRLEAKADDVALTFTSAAAVTVSGITATPAKASGSNAPAWYSTLRLYANNTLTVSSVSGNMTSISMTWTKNSGKSFASVTTNVGTYTHASASGQTGTWTGDASSVVFTVGSSGQIQTTTINVTYTSGGEIPTTYTVTYNANGGTGTMTDSKSPYAENAEVTVLENTFTYANHTFVKWNTEADGKGTDYAEGAKFTITANTTLYAQWQEDEPTPPTPVGDSESVTFSEKGYANGEAVAEYVGTSFTITFDGGTNTNVPKYYDTGKAIRMYGSNSMTIASSRTIETIILTFGTGEGTNGIDSDVGSFDTDTWTGESSSVKLTILGTTGHRRVASVTVNYKSEAPALVKAGQYAKTFVETMTCDGTSSVTADAGAWGQMKTAFLALDEDVQNLLKGHDAGNKDTEVPSGDVTETNAEAYVEAALIRYEWIIRAHGETDYENFMERTINTTSGTNVEPVKFDHATKNNITLVIIILSVAAITALGAYLFIDKRRKVSK